MTNLGAPRSRDLPADELERMRDSVFFDGPDRHRRISRFWILLVLSSTIASAGVVGDSTAAVIGAMIVAPLMTPIQGTMLAVVLGDRRNLVQSMVLLVAGSLTAIAIGWLVGQAVFIDVVAESNSQVAGRVHPRLIDLLAAVATGAVGSIALLRRDISDTLPGVAIAISLVPPLTVVGLTLEAGAWSQAWGALLLFVTNVAAILGVGIVVMAARGVYRMVPPPDPSLRSVNRRNAVLVITALVLVVGTALTASTAAIVADTRRELSVRDVTGEWADDSGWELVEIRTQESIVVARLEGPLPLPDTDTLRSALVDADVDPAGVRVDLYPREVVELGE